MSFKLCVLASGSSGNCVYIATEAVRILIDAGLSCREISVRLAELDVELSSIDAVCVTHEHADHKAALGVLSRKHGISVYANRGTLEAIESDAKMHGINWNVFTTGHPFCIGDMTIEPFTVPHDSYEPVGFIVKTGGVKAGIVTDMGMSTSLIREKLKGCDVAVIEANHDEDMLRNSTRPWSLKQRISGRQGHMSNKQAAELICEIAGPNLRTVFLAHLSDDCNEPARAVWEVKRSLKNCAMSEIDVKLTYGSRISDLVSL